MFYKIYDGRLWDVDTARFVEQAPDGAEIIPLYADGNPAGEDYLRRTLEFYNYPVGFELLTAQEAEKVRFERQRAERDRRLSVTDYLLMPDYPLDNTLKEAVRLYRQALRDLPSQEGAPWDGGGEGTPWPEQIPQVAR